MVGCDDQEGAANRPTPTVDIGIFGRLPQRSLAPHDLSAEAMSYWLAILSSTQNAQPAGARRRAWISHERGAARGVADGG